MVLINHYIVVCNHFSYLSQAHSSSCLSWRFFSAWLRLEISLFIYVQKYQPLIQVQFFQVSDCQIRGQFRWYPGVNWTLKPISSHDGYWILSGYPRNVGFKWCLALTAMKIWCYSLVILKVSKPRKKNTKFSHTPKNQPGL